MSGSAVALTRCTDYSEPKIAEAVARQFELLGGLGRFVSRGDSVLIKPNFIAPRRRGYACQTDPAVIIETARLLKDFGARPFVGDSPAWSNVFACVKELKLEEPLKKMAVPLRQLDKPRECRISAKGMRVGISSIALDADVIINLPKFKTHQQLMATFAVKNMFGCVSGKRKALWHFAKGGRMEDFCQLLIEIYRFLSPVVTIIDAVVVMDGPGPIRGRARPLGWLIGGTDPIACETVCCGLVGIRPGELPIIKTAVKMGLLAPASSDASRGSGGCLEPDEIKIVGDDFQDSVCTDFKLPELIPLRFSFLQVCKSICKQILLLARLSKMR